MNGHDAPVVLSVRHLSVRFANGAHAVRDVSFDVAAGRCLALVGESGCGKSTVGRAILGVHPGSARVGGSVIVADRPANPVEMIGLDAPSLQSIRRGTLGYVAQDPFSSCDPLRSVRHHIEEPHRVAGIRVDRDDAVGRLTGLGVEQAKSRVDDRPHQWSGGMLQRATIAAATSQDPVLVIADEPTSALDADCADITIELLRAQSDSLLLISHDLALVGRYADDVAVIYAGRIVETGPAECILSAPRHPYSQALLASVPRVGRGLPMPLAGRPPSPFADDNGCAFARRCSRSQPSCTTVVPPLVDGLACPPASGTAP